MLYIGFTMLHGADGEDETCRFIMHNQNPPFVQKNGRMLTKYQDAIDFGFKVVVLLETSFAFNARRLETMLQTQFWDHPNRLCFLNRFLVPKIFQKIKGSINYNFEYMIVDHHRTLVGNSWVCFF